MDVVSALVVIVVVVVVIVLAVVVVVERGAILARLIKPSVLLGALLQLLEPELRMCNM